MIEHLNRILELGAGIYIEGKLIEIIDVVKIGDPITIVDKEYRQLTWLAIGEEARWHSNMVEDCHYDDDTSTIKFRYNNHNWGISSLQGAHASYVEFYETWRKKYAHRTEFRLKKIDEIIENNYDTLLSRISPE